MQYFAALYEIERDAAVLNAEKRRRLHQSQAKPVCDALHEWMVAQRKRVSEGSAIAKAMEYSLKRWEALTRYLDDEHVRKDNNWVENQIRPWAISYTRLTKILRSRLTFCQSSTRLLQPVVDRWHRGSAMCRGRPLLKARVEHSQLECSHT